jgi:hypothetical protein
MVPALSWLASGRASTDWSQPELGWELSQADEADEDTNPDKGTATPTKPAQAPPGPLTRARAHELNFVMILKNEGPEDSKCMRHLCS